MIRKYWDRYKKFKHFVGPEVMKLLKLAVLAGFFLFCVESSFIFVIQAFLYVIGIAPKETLMLPSWYPLTLAATVAALILFGLARALAFFYKTYLMGIVSQAFTRVQRERIVAFSLENAFEISTQESISMFTEYVNAAGNVLQLLLTMILTLTSSFFLFVLGAKIAPIPMLFGVVFLSLIALPLRKFDKLIDRAGAGLAAEWTQVSSTLLDGIKQNFFLKVYGLINFEKDKAFKSLERFENHHKKYYFAYAAKSAVPAFFGVVILGCIAFLSVKYFQIKGAILVSFFYLFIRLIQTISEGFSGMGLVRLYFHYLKKLYAWQLQLEVLQQKVKAEPLPSSEETRRFETSVNNGGVEIEGAGVSFKYPTSEKWLFKNLSFNLKRGECLVVTGESGTGKSTLLSLILGINSPLEGNITVNGQEIEKMRLQLFKEVGYIGPDPYLINGTIRENLLYGQPNPASISENDIKRSLEIANAYDFVMKLPEKENTFLNEYAKISTGQKQRLAIARAFLRKPKILVMDECTSNLDSQNEAEIIRSLEKLKANVTTIIVTHRPAFKGIATQQINLV